MMKINRREVISLFLASSASAMVGCSHLSVMDEQPKLPDRCVWVEIPYGFACINLDALSKEVSMAKSEAYQPPSEADLGMSLNRWEDFPFSLSKDPQ